MRQEEDRGEAGGGERAEAQAGAESPRSVENRFVALKVVFIS